MRRAWHSLQHCQTRRSGSATHRAAASTWMNPGVQQASAEAENRQANRPCKELKVVGKIRRPVEVRGLLAKEQDKDAGLAVKPLRQNHSTAQLPTVCGIQTNVFARPNLPQKFTLAPNIMGLRKVSTQNVVYQLDRTTTPSAPEKTVKNSKTGGNTDRPDGSDFARQR